VQNEQGQAVKARRANPARVYPAESDPRQAVDPLLVHPSVILGPARTGTTEELAREFGPWVRGADGRWQRDRRKR